MTKTKHGAWGDVRRHMASIVRDSYEDGEVNCTRLAEQAALECGLSDRELDDELSPIWEIALEFADWQPPE